MIEPMEFRDRLVKMSNLTRTEFAKLFFNQNIPAHENNAYIDIKWKQFNEDPFSAMLMLDQTNFTRVAKFLLEEER